MGYGNDSFFLAPLMSKLEKWSKSPLAVSVKSGLSPLLKSLPKNFAIEYNKIGLCNIDKIDKPHFRRLLPLRTDFTLEKEWKNDSK